MHRHTLLQAGIAMSSARPLPAFGGGDDPPAPAPPPAPATSYAIRAERNVAIPVRNGTLVVADIFRPDVADGATFPVLITMGAYGKDALFKDFRADDWARMEMKSGEGALDYMNYETPLPDYWVPQGYVCVRCDQPGSGDSPGKLNVFGRETQLAFYDAIEWAGTQRWSNGKVGILGDSYYAAIQWLVAQLQPPHLAAILPFGGFTDLYRDCVRHGGILSSAFVDNWYRTTVLAKQYGAPTGTSTVKLTASQLAQNNSEDIRELLREDALLFATNEYFTERTPDLSKITVPVYAWANDDNLGLHVRGTIDGFLKAEAAPYRRLHTYAGLEPDTMYTRAAADLHRRFFDHFLKGEDNGFETEPRVTVTVKKGGDAFATRTGNSYPLEQTSAQKLYLDCGTKQLLSSAPARPATLSYRSAYGSAASLVRFSTPPLPADLELIGPMKLHLTMSAADADADLFIAVREFMPDGQEVTTRGATPISMGWQRASMRNADPARSTTFRTWHTYDRSLLLARNAPVTLDINIWPAAWIVAGGNTLVVEIGGNEQKGMVTFTHPSVGPYSRDGVTPVNNNAPPPTDVTLYSGGIDPSYLMMPVFLATTG